MNEADESSEEVNFRKHIFYVVLDNVIEVSCSSFECSETFFYIFSFRWNLQRMSREILHHNAANISEKYSNDIGSEDLVLEMNHMTMVHNANLDRKQLGALELLNVSAEYRL